MNDKNNNNKIINENNNNNINENNNNNNINENNNNNNINENNNNNINENNNNNINENNNNNINDNNNNSVNDNNNNDNDGYGMITITYKLLKDMTEEEKEYAWKEFCEEMLEEVDRLDKPFNEEELKIVREWFIGTYSNQNVLRKWKHPRYDPDRHYVESHITFKCEDTPILKFIVYNPEYDVFVDVWKKNPYYVEQPKVDLPEDFWVVPPKDGAVETEAEKLDLLTKKMIAQRIDVIDEIDEFLMNAPKQRELRVKGKRRRQAPTEKKNILPTPSILGLEMITFTKGKVSTIRMDSDVMYSKKKKAKLPTDSTSIIAFKIDKHSTIQLNTLTRNPLVTVNYKRKTK